MTNFSGLPGEAKHLCTCFEGSVLKLLFRWKSYLLIFSKSLLRILVVVSDNLTVEKWNVSSADNLGLY